MTIAMIMFNIINNMNIIIQFLSIRSCQLWPRRSRRSADLLFYIRWKQNVVGIEMLSEKSNLV